MRDEVVLPRIVQDFCAQNIFHKNADISLLQVAGDGIVDAFLKKWCVYLKGIAPCSIVVSFTVAFGRMRHVGNELNRRKTDSIIAAFDSGAF